MELKIFNISNIFDENDNINYFKYLLITLTTPKYISNITYWLIIFSILFDNKMLVHSLLPLCITNAIIISIAALMKKSFKYNKNNKQFKNEKQLESINKLYNKNVYLYKLFLIIVHFIIPVYIIYTKKHLDRKSHSNFIFSFLLIVLLISLYALSFNNNTYKSFDMNGKNLYYIAPIYLTCNLIVSYFYFY